MSEFTIEIQTVGGAVAHPPDDIEGFEAGMARVAEVLEERGGLAPVFSLNRRTGAASATFQVEAASVTEAADLGVRIFGGALAVLGLEEMEGHLNVEELDTITIAPSRDREAVLA